MKVKINLIAMLCMGLVLVSSAGAIMIVPDFGVGEKMSVGNVEFGKPVSPEKVNLYLTAQNSPPVNIPDRALANAIKKALGKRYGAVLTREDMEKLTELNVSQIGKTPDEGETIKNLTGLEYAVNLTNLDISGNKVDSLSALTNLTKLTRLVTIWNKISDLTPLANLTQLNYLDLWNNQIQDITPIANLTQLSYLVLNGNIIWDIAPLANFIKLHDIDVSWNDIDDIGALVDNMLNGGLGSGDFVSIVKNYLDLTPGSKAMQDIQKLKDKGVGVSYNPQRK